jgi:hypothetical protein
MQEIIGGKVRSACVIAPEEELDICLLLCLKHFCNQLADFLLRGHEAKVSRATKPIPIGDFPGGPEGRTRSGAGNSQKRSPKKGLCLARPPAHHRSNGFALDLCQSSHSFTR